jgi:hypothetical protein
VTAAYTARARTLVFWALAGVTFSAAKIVSCNKNFFFHGLPSTLLQLYYFRKVGHKCCVPAVPANDLGRLALASEVAGGHAIKCFKIGRSCHF